MQDIDAVEKSGFFNEKFYLSTYPEVKDLDISPLAHYLQYGWKEGKDPNLFFSTEQYLRYYPDAAAQQICPLVHFISAQKTHSLYKDNHDFSLYKDVELCHAENINYEKLKRVKACILIHIYYEEGIFEIARYLKNVPEYIHVYISSDTDEKLEIFREYLKNNIEDLNIEFVKVLNKGRDVGALLIGFNEIVRKYDYFAFLHYKKSPNAIFGRRWRHYLFDNLLGSKHGIESILSDFLDNEKLGIVLSPVFPSFIGISLCDLRANKINCDDFLQNRLGFDAKINIGYKFPMGSMFWARTKSVLNLFDLHLTYEELDVPYTTCIDGKIYDDGSILHCIERLWCFVAENNNYIYKEVLLKNTLCASPVIKKRIAILSCQHLNYNVLLYEKCLEKIADKVVLVINSHTLSEDDLIKLKLDYQVIIRKGMGFNYASWREGMHKLGYDYLEQYEELILCDDSCLFPLGDLDNVFLEMENAELDFWAINGFYGENEDLIFAQSHFYVFKNKVFNSEVFKKYFENVQESDDINIEHMDNIFTKTLISAEFKYESYHSFHPSDVFPLSVFIGGSPLISIYSLHKIVNKLSLWYDFVNRISKQDLRNMPLAKNIID